MMLKSTNGIQTKTESTVHVDQIDRTTYEVVSNYKGDIPFVDLLKKMIKRDVDRMGA